MLVPVPLVFVRNKNVAKAKAEKELQEIKKALEVKPAVRRRPKREHTLLQRSAVSRLQREAKWLAVCVCACARACVCACARVCVSGKIGAIGVLEWGVDP